MRALFVRTVPVAIVYDPTASIFTVYIPTASVPAVCIPSASVRSVSVLAIVTPAVEKPTQKNLLARPMPSLTVMSMLA